MDSALQSIKGTLSRTPQKPPSAFWSFFRSVGFFIQNNWRDLISVAAIFITPYIIRAVLYPKPKSASSQRLNLLLKSVQKRQKRNGTIVLNEYERVIAGNILIPEEIKLTFDDIGGLDEIKGQIQETVIFQLQHPELCQRGKLMSTPKGVLFYGPPGTGKTMLAKAIAKTAEASFINLNISNIFDKWLGESEKLIAAVFSLAEKIEPCIIFIDEIDSWLGKRSGQDHETSARVKALFMSLWDGMLTNPSTRITIIAASNRPGTLDEAILRRLPVQFHIGLPDQYQREQILRVILASEHIDPLLDYHALAQVTEGYSGSDLHSLAQAAARAPIKDYIRSPKDIDSDEIENPALRHITYNDFIQAMKIVGPTGVEAIRYEQQQIFDKNLQNINQMFRNTQRSTTESASTSTNSTRPVVVNINFMPIMNPVNENVHDVNELS